MSELTTLEEMGFPRPRAEKALVITGNQGVEAAMEWLLAHGDDPDVDAPLAPASSTVAAPAMPTGVAESSMDSSSQPEQDAALGLGTEDGAEVGSAGGMDVREERSKSEMDSEEAETKAKKDMDTEEVEAMKEEDGNGAEMADGGGGEGEDNHSNEAEEGLAKSIQCTDCGKLFLTTEEVEFHAVKTGHSNFSESKEEKRPLTEEEKREQLRKIEEKLRQKRREREEQEKKDAIEREKQRIKAGKELAEAKRKMEDEEIRKLAELRRREKQEAKAARDRVKAQIEQDKIMRRAKFGMAAPPEAAATSEALPSSANLPKSSLPPSSATVSSTATKAAKEYAETRLQIRLTNGEALTQTFGAKEQLAAVRLYVELNRTDGGAPFALMTAFPNKIFTEEDYEAPLDVLGLVPSAVLIVTRSQ